ncbi:hypothetical protein [Paenibacillus endoradicis]|uniref:hypothetical protein n=1 Tax=Paenibacillus endoradicis TaxID=2972487 RepID=UPI0021598A97|nr:hypothetical protein [Paenibacillus endoradicis]MCR8656935.1 hypothetical protein [Paenibacillus endoradicis]
MFYEFSHRFTPCLVDGNAENVVLSRETKATTVMGKEYVYNGLLSPKSAIELGMIIETDVSFLVLTMRTTVERDKYCSLLKTNALVEVQRYSQTYDALYNPVGGPSFKSIEVGVKCFVQYVSAQLRMDEPGLLATTSYVLVLQTTVDVRKPQDELLLSPDRIMLDGRPYQVDVVDGLKYPNLLHVQLSEELR